MGGAGRERGKVIGGLVAMRSRAFIHIRLSREEPWVNAGCWTGRLLSLRVPGRQGR